MGWDPLFTRRSPIFEPLVESAKALREHSTWPSREALDTLMAAREICNARGVRLRLVAPPRRSAESYEERVYACGELIVRDGDWHDFMNVLVWLTYPKIKAALNARHVAELARCSDVRDGRRGTVRDALTVFDESGAVVASCDVVLLEDLRAFAWQRLFVERRSRVTASLRVHVLGHALLVKVLAPYRGLTAHALTLVAPSQFGSWPMHQQIEWIDGVVSRRCAEPHELLSPRALSPLPVLGVPGWWPANADPAFYDDAISFRRGRVRRATT